MYKIAVLGERDGIYGFACVGLDIYPVEDITKAGRQLRTLAETGYAVIYVTEAVFAQIPDEIALYADKPLPAVIAIPGVAGTNGSGVAAIKKSVERAVGSDILFGSN